MKGNMIGTIGIVYIAGSVLALCSSAAWSTIFLNVGLGIVMVGIGNVSGEIANLSDDHKDLRELVAKDSGEK